MKKKTSRKTSTIFLLVAIALFTIGGVLVYCAFKYKTCTNCDMPSHVESFGEQYIVNPGFLMGGIFSIFLGFMPLFVGLSPYMDRVSVNLEKETIDMNKDVYKDLASKNVDLTGDIIDENKEDLTDIASDASDIMDPVFKKVSHSLVEPIASKKKTTKKERLLEIQELLKEGLITQEEYEQLRKKILEL